MDCLFTRRRRGRPAAGGLPAPLLTSRPTLSHAAVASADVSLRAVPAAAALRLGRLRGGRLLHARARARPPAARGGERRRRGRRLPPPARRALRLERLRRRIHEFVPLGVRLLAWTSRPGRNDDRRLHEGPAATPTSAGPAPALQEGRVAARPRVEPEPRRDGAAGRSDGRVDVIGRGRRPCRQRRVPGRSPRPGRRPHARARGDVGGRPRGPRPGAVHATSRRIRSRRSRPPARPSSTSTSSRSTCSRPRTPSLLDPALVARSTAPPGPAIGYRVRVAPTDGVDAATQALAALTPGRRVARPAHRRPATGAAASTDPCAPPGDPLGEVPDGLLPRRGARRRPRPRARRSPGRTRTARPRSQIVERRGRPGHPRALAPALRGRRPRRGVLARAPRRPRSTTGRCTRWTRSRAAAGGDVVTLDRAGDRRRPARRGLALRRWDGQSVGAAGPRDSPTHRGRRPGHHVQRGRGRLPGRRLVGRAVARRGGRRDRAPHRRAVPTACRHVFAPAGPGRPRRPAPCSTTAGRTFTPLVDLDRTGRLHRLGAAGRRPPGRRRPRCPPGGGEICFAAGVYALATPLLVAERSRVVFTGAGPATCSAPQGHEAAVVFDRCREVEVRGTCASRAAAPASPPGDPAPRRGAHLRSPERPRSRRLRRSPARTATGRSQTCLTVRPVAGGTQPDRVRIERNRLDVGRLADRCADR